MTGWVMSAILGGVIVVMGIVMWVGNWSWTKDKQRITELEGLADYWMEEADRLSHQLNLVESDRDQARVRISELQDPKIENYRPSAP